jgi:hypothetical protein
MNLSYESDGKMGKDNHDKKELKENEQEFFNITPSSE